MVLRRTLPYFLAGALGAAACADQKQEEATLLKHTVTTTDNSGSAVVEDHTLRVYDEQQNPLAGITLHHLQRNGAYLSLAVDPHGEYFPERQSSTAGIKPLRREGSLDEIIFVLEKADEAQVLEPYTAPGRTLLEEESAVNKYCMSLEYMESAYIDAPAGIIALVGTLVGRDVEEIKTKVTTKLKSIFEQHIVTKYGRHEGYEVWVPKTAISLCGEEYDGVVCSLDSLALSERVWNNHFPYWMIRGACLPKGALSDAGVQGDHRTPEMPDTGVDRCTSRDLRVCSNNSVYWQDSCGNLEEVVHHCTAQEDCNAGQCLPRAYSTCDLPSCIQYGVSSCDEPCVNIESANRCVLPCTSDADCQVSASFMMRCYGLSQFNGQTGKGCFMIPCENNTPCPPDLSCVNLTGQGYLQTTSGAEPLAATLSFDICYDPNCL